MAERKHGERLSIEEQMRQMPCHGNEGIDILCCRHWQCFQCGFNPAVHQKRVNRMLQGEWKTRQVVIVSRRGEPVDTLELTYLHIPKKLTKEEAAEREIVRG